MISKHGCPPYHCKILLALAAVMSVLPPAAQSSFTCYPPMEDLLSEDSSVQFSEAFTTASNWAESHFTNMTSLARGDGINRGQSGADSAIITVFAPSGDPVYQKGFGNLGSNSAKTIPPDGDSVYRIASITKLFTAMEVLLMRDKGMINLDADISTYIHGFSYPSKTWRERLESSANFSSADEPGKVNHSRSRKEKITMRQLLNQISGTLRDVVKDQPWPLYNEGRTEFLLPNSSIEVFRSINDNPPTNNPSTYPSYSNLGFILAGYVIEGAELQARTARAREEKRNPAEESHRSAASLIQRDILDPLKLTSTTFNTPLESNGDHFAVPNNSDYKQWSFRDLAASKTAFGLSSSSNDLLRMGQTILKLYHSDQSNEAALSSATIREWINPSYNFGQGLNAIGAPWEIFHYLPANHSNPDQDARVQRVYSKDGVLPGYNSYMFLDPDRQFGGVILFTGQPLDLLYTLQQVATRFGNAFDAHRQSILEKRSGKYCLEGSESHSNDSMVVVKPSQGSLWITEWTLKGANMLKEMHLNDLLGQRFEPRLVLWPTSEKNIYRAGIGRPPVNHYEGCIMQYTSMGSVFSNGFPMDLVFIEDGIFYLPAAKLIYSKCE